MKKLLFCIILILLMMFTVACSEEEQKDTDIVITTELEPDEIFRLSDLPCRISEANVYMRTAQNQYSSVFGPQILEKDIDGKTLSDELKDTTLSRLAQIKAMTLLAKDHEIELSENQKSLIKQASEKYYSSLDTKEAEALNITKDIIEQMYTEYALSTLVYDDITSGVNPEIGDDEARAVTVKHILIKTYSTDALGNKVDYTASMKADAGHLISKIYGKLNDGEDFDALCEKYNEDEQSTYTFCKGTMPESFENAAFDLDTDEISPVVETEYGYHIIKCIETLDRNETDANKLKIVQKHKNEVFNQVYDEFIKTIYSNMNEELWESLKFDSDSLIDTVDFFDVYNSYDITK